MKLYIFFLSFILISGCSNFFQKSEQPTHSECIVKPQLSLQNQPIEAINITENPINISRTIQRNQTLVYSFEAQAGQKLSYQVNEDICLWIYSPDHQLIKNNILPQTGKYIIQISTLKGFQPFELQMSLGTSNLSPFAFIPQQPDLEYNLKTKPNFTTNPNLQAIINKLVKLAAANNLPTEALSITLIDVNSGEEAGYQAERLRYPASVVKIFWMVAFYAQMKQGNWQNNPENRDNLVKMIKKSDNEGSSYIFDKITNTKSGADLSEEDYQTWLKKREKLNHFFQAGGYKDININQKTFPIPSLGEYGKFPKGYELKMRGDPNQPTRNKVSTEQAARLMYEIVSLQAVSQKYSLKMTELLTRDLRKEAWINIDTNFEFNPIRAFLGEGLPVGVQFLSKAGWTSQTRQEVAFVKDGSASYILTIFAEDPAYARNAKIFPEMSKFVFKQMKGF